MSDTIYWRESQSKPGVTIGSRTAAEHANDKIEPVHGGNGGVEAGDTLAFTVNFNPEQATANHTILGCEFSLTGRTVESKISIVDPHR